MQSSEDALSKIDGVITDIRMINLQLFNFVSGWSKDESRDVDKQRKIQQFSKINKAHFQQYVKRVSDYLKRSFQDLKKIKLVLSPVVFRALKPEYQKQNFLRFQNEVLGVKFIITNLDKEAVLHVQIYRKMRGGRMSSEALKKLQITFTADLIQKAKDFIPSQQMLQSQGKFILDEATAILSGHLCNQCQTHLAFNPQSKTYLPPTLRQIEEVKEGKGKASKRVVYYHQSCL